MPIPIASDGTTSTYGRKAVAFHCHYLLLICRSLIVHLFLVMIVREAAHEIRNLIRCGIEREMARIKHVDLGVRHVIAVALRLSGIK